jgi:hypothetical protein
MKRLCRIAIVSLLVFASQVYRTPSQATAANEIPNTSGVHGFDFLVGDWRVHHRYKRPGTSDWQEFDGTATNRPLMDGWGNVEEHRFARPTGTTYGIGLRAYDAKSGDWAIWWVDSRAPHNPMDPPTKGHFENGIGHFYCDYVQDGRPTRLRFIWSHITSKSARWEQATSTDSGKTWDTNWIMEFQRM